ncbi:hypothetical protein ACJIZ3_002769 [Penstemon smallii]|uniref:DYW domain-containing protein n=1 Tax=Penstemon smallii TaxID=265156 RepID=A0ABD3U8V6_9LAMI
MLRSSSSISRLPLDFLAYKYFADLNNSKLAVQQSLALIGFINPSRRLCDSLTSEFSFPYDLISSINTCFSVLACKKIHAQVIKTLNYRDGFIGDRLVSLYTKLDHLQYAQNLFDEMPDKDLVSWNSLISGFSKKGELINCLNALYRMRLEMGLGPNEVTLICILSACTDTGAFLEGVYIHGIAVKTGLINETKLVNSLINIYGKFGCLDLARLLFSTMQEPSLVSWNSIILVFVENGVSDEAVRMFNMMKRVGVNPDQATIVTLLQGCGDIGIINLAETMHGYILRAGLDENIAITTSMLSLYSKSGKLDSSKMLFEGMKDPDRIAWTAMIGGYSMHGRGKEAIKYFDLMVKRGLKPDHVTFTHLLSACSHSGLLIEGKRYFDTMSSVYGVEPKLDHYSCMVDLFGRSSCLKEAHDLIKKMPMEPNHGVWGALLNACRISNNVELGKEVAEKLFILNPYDQRNYVMLSNIYSAAGHYNDALKIKSLMKKRGVVRTVGCSFIEHRNKIHRFVVGDRSHQETHGFYLKLDELIKKIEVVGYKPMTKLVLHDVNEDVKVEMIKEHSEKLAIAFGLLVTEEGVPLVITKNLRICGDCHSMAKFVSLTEAREIIIRDVKRFHHFANGLCSCGDYW